jgi:hypothetical protein
VTFGAAALAGVAKAARDPTAQTVSANAVSIHRTGNMALRTNAMVDSTTAESTNLGLSNTLHPSSLLLLKLSRFRPAAVPPPQRRSILAPPAPAHK